MQQRNRSSRARARPSEPWSCATVRLGRVCEEHGAARRESCKRKRRKARRVVGTARRSQLIDFDLGCGEEWFLALPAGQQRAAVAEWNGRPARLRLRLLVDLEAAVERP